MTPTPGGYHHRDSNQTPPKTTKNRPHELQAARMKAIGKASQILPSYLRMVCRSRLDCTPIEVLDHARIMAKTELHAARQRLPDYHFVEVHEAIVHQYTTEQILDLIIDEIDHQTPKTPYSQATCRLMERGAGGKKACWICPIMTATIQRLRPAFLPDTPPARPPHKPYTGLWNVNKPGKDNQNDTREKLTEDLKAANTPEPSPE